ncbi:hypothetical protein KC19_12G040500 [Ceratodon purpureus]|uniref:Uncharacterized protein n=1 Tax=Ceratodon purpureus TaxID=3225 RepID=A0A8T0G5W0_CERPU|nr:hypothetical protein KC19_12G040500 [Ceratodon purpureus]
MWLMMLLRYLTVQSHSTLTAYIADSKVLSASFELLKLFSGVPGCNRVFFEP